jgi:hypothetical protein
MTDLIDGVVIRMGGRDWIVPPLTFRQLRRLQPKLEGLARIRLGGDMSLEHVTTLCEIVQAALARNYPELSLDDIEDLLDLGNARAVVTAILTGSGLATGEPEAGS